MERLVVILYPAVLLQFPDSFEFIPDLNTIVFSDREIAYKSTKIVAI